MANNKIRFLFDECIGWPLMEDFGRLVEYDRAEVEFGHAVRMGFGGTNDEIWIPQIARDGWMIVTADSGKHPKPGSGQKLPSLCMKWRVTYVILSRSLAKAKGFEKVRAMVAVWDAMLAMKDAPPGSGFSIRRTGLGKFSLVLFRPAPETPGPATQRLLLPAE